MAQEVIEITEREIEIIEVIERGPVGPTGPQPDINYTVVSSARTLEAADLIAADTSGGSFTLTLPTNPSNGDAVDIFDFSETFDTNPLTIARNGQPIESLNEDLVANVEGAYFTLIYTGATRGWQVLPRYGGGGSGGELTTEGDILYRGPAVNTRLGIGTAGQILKVNSTATAPEWGAAPDSIDDYTVVTISQTLANGARIAADTTSGSFTLTLPATPQGGDTVYILDYAQTFDTNNLILARNGSNIEGLAEDMTCNVEGSSFKMVFTGASTGWQMIPYYGTGVAIGSNATDVLSLSSGQILADDPAADRLVFWDDSESKLTYLQAGSGLTISGTTISASGGDTVTIDASAADVLSATSGTISADDFGADKLWGWDDSESKAIGYTIGSGLETDGATLKTSSAFTDTQIFTANGTWTKPAGAKLVHYLLIGGGGGGGGGRRSDSSTAASGGQGGNGGGICVGWVDPAALGATESVTVGSGGAGGTSRAGLNNIDGSNALFGGDTTFHSAKAIGGLGGAGGGTAALGYNTSVTNAILHYGALGSASRGGATSVTGNSLSGIQSDVNPSAGGGGGSKSSSNVYYVGGHGGTIGNSQNRVGQTLGGQAASSTAGGNGGSSHMAFFGTGGAGGSPSSSTGAATKGGNGGNYGGGGGGGSGCLNDAGGDDAGGDGGNGIAVITTYF